MAARGVNDIGYKVLCENNAKKIKFTHEWVIRDFYYTWKYIGNVKSGPFQLPENLGKGSLSLSPEFAEEDPDFYRDEEIFGPPQPWVSMAINLIIDLPTLVIGVKAYAVNSNGQATKICKGERATRSEKNIEIKLDELITLHELYDWKSVEIATVTIFCDFTIITDIDCTVDKHYQQVLPLEFSLANELRTLLNDPEHSDVTITVGNKTFHVHKLILSTRSPVFRAMFEHKMKENESNNIDIMDMSEEVVEELLNFIYTDATDKADEMTLELLDAAEKYDVNNLKLLCAHNLHKNLNIGNAVENLILADRYNAEGVKQYILKFISSHKKEVMKTIEYKTMKETHPHLVIEAFEAMSLD